MRKKVTFGILVVVFLFISLLLNEYINKGLGGFFGFLSIGFAYRQIFKKDQKPTPENGIVLNKEKS